MHIDDLWKRKDGTRTARYGKGKRWRAVYGPNRESRTFRTQDEARAFLVATEHKQRRGEYVPVQNRKALVSDLLPLWEESLIRLKPSTSARIGNEIAVTLGPRWGTHQVGAVNRQDVQAWVYEMHGSGLAPRTVDTKYGVLRAFYTWCVVEGHVPASPCQNITLPRGHNREHVFLTPRQVHALIEATPEHHRIIVEVLVTTGLRFGEASELRVKDLDLPRRRAAVARSYTSGHVTIPKTYQRRSVPLTASVAAQLAERTEGKVRNALVLTNESGTRLDVDNWRKRIFHPARNEAGMPAELTVKDLRHTSASLAVSSGANVKAVQRMLGHASAAVSLDIYSGLFTEDLDAVAERMGDLLDDSSTHTHNTQTDHRA